MLVGEVVAVRCAHGDSVEYPLADIKVEIEGRKMTVPAGVSDRLPVQILLGRDVPELVNLLHSVGNNKVDPELVAVATRSKLRSIDQSSHQFSSVDSKVVSLVL